MTALRIIGEIFDASKLTPEADGTLRLPAWMRYRCESVGTTAQTSETTVAVGFEAHAARAFSLDGESFGLLVSKGGYTQRITTQDLNLWSTVSAVTIEDAVAPDGTTAACEIVDDSGATEFVFNIVGALSAGTYTLQAWRQLVSTTGGNCGFTVRDIAVGTDQLQVLDHIADPAWERVSGTFTLAATSDANTQVRALPSSTSTHTARLRAYHVHLAAGSYAQPFYDGTAKPASVPVVAAALCPDGFVRVPLKYRPHYGSTQSSGDHHLWYFNEDNRLYFRKSDSRFVLILNGVVYVSEVVTFAGHQEVEVSVYHAEGRVRIVVAGATTGNGATVGDGQPAITLTSAVAYLLGGPDGAEETSDLTYCAPAKSFCELLLERFLSQTGEENAADFRAIACTLAEGPARIYDTAIAVREGFDLETAYGAQLDAIGANVGLTREGFEDDRYRDFLRIQTALLLSVARAEAEWTGTAPNLIEIARTFIGPTPGEFVLYIQARPYAYLLHVPGLDLDEGELLVRFLRIATYGGVSAIVLVPIADFSLYDDDEDPITDAGVWDDDEVPQTDAAVWGMALEV